MTLDEAIAHAEEMANETPCGQEHRQLADWLKELRELKTNPFGNKSAIWEALKEMGKELDFCEANVEKGIGLSPFGLGRHCEILRGIKSKATTSSIRNCDVGNAKEQENRMNAFCDIQQHCNRCPIVDYRCGGVSCYITFSQMPYEGEV